MEKKKKKETGRWLIDQSVLLDRDKVYVDLGPGDSPSLPKRARKVRYYSTKDPKYWIDHSILVEWLMQVKSTVLEKCSNAKFQEWYLRTIAKSTNPKWSPLDRKSIYNPCN